MSKQRREDSHSDLEEKESVSLPAIAAEGSSQNVSDDTGISRRRVMEKEHRYEHLIQGVEKAKHSIRRVQFATLSRVVNTAFTGWTIKTQS